MRALIQNPQSGSAARVYTGFTACDSVKELASFKGPIRLRRRVRGAAKRGRYRAKTAREAGSGGEMRAPKVVHSESRAADINTLSGRCEEEFNSSQRVYTEARGLELSGDDGWRFCGNVYDLCSRPEIQIETPILADRGSLRLVL